MVSTPDSYSTAKRNLDNAIQTIADASEELDRIISRLNSLNSTVAALGPSYGPTASFIETTAAANPGVAGWQALKAQKDRVVPDFQGLASRVAAVKAAVDGAT